VAAARRSIELLGGCPGASPPWLALPATPEVLSTREREVAELAALGLSSRAIADRLFVSVRTVDNHLYRSYSKLGVDSREELAIAFGTKVSSE
jgi:DNA-binding NarL/FixJ family response regulator